MAGNLIRQVKIQDGVDDSILQTVNASKEALVKDADVETAINAVETAVGLTTSAVNAVETNQTDKSQITQITDGTEELAINASNEATTHDADLLSKATDIETNQTDKSQYTRLTDGTDDGSITANSDDTDNLDGENGLVVNAVQYMRLDSDNVSPLRADASTHSLQTMDYEHHEIHAGSHYMVCGVQDLAINHVLDFTWLMPDTTKWIHWTWSIDCESETLWQVYEGAVATNPLGNLITPYNNNRNSGNTSGTVMKFEDQANLAAANADTDVSGAILLQSGIVGSGKRSLGNVERSREIVLDQGVLYCLRATATAAGYINFCMQWYEHVNKN